MSAKTGIEWTDATWNPIRGVRGKWSCVKVSPGCANCYAEAMNVRFGGPRYTVGADELRLDPDVLAEPRQWKKPRRVFVCSMTDLFEERVKDEWIESVWTTMGRSPNHTFQVLTKRAERMRDVMAGLPTLPNVWLGVSVEDQERADERIPLLLQTPAAVRFVSAEPLLGPVDFLRLGTMDDGTRGALSYDALAGGWWHRRGRAERWIRRDEGPRLDWVIVGGESGPGARPMDLAWARSTVKQCRAAGVAVFVKQLGARPDGAGFSVAARYTGRLRDRKGGDPSEWPDDLRVREWPA